MVATRSATDDTDRVVVGYWPIDYRQSADRHAYVPVGIFSLEEPRIQRCQLLHRQASVCIRLRCHCPPQAEQAAGRKSQDPEHLAAELKSRIPTYPQLIRGKRAVAVGSNDPTARGDQDDAVHPAALRYCGRPGSQSAPGHALGPDPHEMIPPAVNPRLQNVPATATNSSTR